MASSDLNNPSYRSPNGVTEQRTNLGGTSPGTSPSEPGAERRAEATPGEKLGRFFRHAMERLSGHDEDQWRRGNERNERDRDTQDRYRTGDRSWQYGRSALRGREDWRDLGRSRDDRNSSYRGGLSGDTGGSDERLQSGSRSGQGGQERGPSFENRSGQVGDQGRDDSSRRDSSRSDPYRDRWAAERSAQSGATGMKSAYPASQATFGFGRDEERVADWGETERDRDEGQGRRFWQREPLAARDVMTRNPRTVSRQSAHREAAAIMRDENCGVVPVVDASGRLEGILTDRDIVVRGVAHDRAHELHIEDVMTDDVSAVTEDEPLTSVLDLMGRKQIRRVPVVDRDDKLLGIISMADIANRADYDEDLQDAFERISSRRSFWSLFS